MDVSESGLVFFNPKSGVEVALGVNSAFPFPENRFFDFEESDEHIMRLLLDESMATELVMFCIDSSKDELPFFTDGQGVFLLDDIDFLLRFWKRRHYHSKPSVSYIGTKRK